MAAQHERQPQVDQSTTKAQESRGCEPEHPDTDHQSMLCPDTDHPDKFRVGKETNKARMNPTQWHATAGNGMIEPEAKRWQLNPNDEPLKDCYNSTEELRADMLRLYGIVGSKVCESGIQTHNSNELGIQDLSKWDSNEWL